MVPAWYSVKCGRLREQVHGQLPKHACKELTQSYCDTFGHTPSAVGRKLRYVLHGDFYGAVAREAYNSGKMVLLLEPTGPNSAAGKWRPLHIHNTELGVPISQLQLVHIVCRT